MRSLGGCSEACSPALTTGCKATIFGIDIESVTPSLVSLPMLLVEGKMEWLLQQTACQLIWKPNTVVLSPSVPVAVKDTLTKKQHGEEFLVRASYQGRNSKKDILGEQRENTHMGPHIHRAFCSFTVQDPIIQRVGMFTTNWAFLHQLTIKTPPYMHAHRPS